MLHLRQCGAANRHPQECEATWLPFCGRRQPFRFGCDALQHTSPITPEPPRACLVTRGFVLFSTTFKVLLPHAP